MKKVYKLFKYKYISYCQGTADKSTEYALLYVPDNASFNNNRSVLYSERHQDNYHEIDIESVKDLSIGFFGNSSPNESKKDDIDEYYDKKVVKTNEAFKNLTEWLLKHKRSVFLNADISLEDKKLILYDLNISTDILN